MFYFIFYNYFFKTIQKINGLTIINTFIKFFLKFIFFHQGEWKNDKMEGKGTYFYANGDRYEGKI